MLGDVGLEIAELKPCPMKRTPNRPHRQRSCRSLVCSVDLRAINLGLTIQSNQSISNRMAHLWRVLSPHSSINFQHRSNDLAISAAAEEHAALSLHNVHFGRL